MLVLAPAVRARLQHVLARDRLRLGQRLPQNRPVLNDLRIEQFPNAVLALRVAHIRVCVFRHRADGCRRQSARRVFRPPLQHGGHNLRVVLVSPEDARNALQHRVVAKLVERSRSHRLGHVRAQRHAVFAVRMCRDGLRHFRADDHRADRRKGEVHRNFRSEYIKIHAVALAVALLDGRKPAVVLVLSSGFDQPRVGHRHTRDHQSRARQPAPQIHHELALIKAQPVVCFGVDQPVFDHRIRKAHRAVLHRADGDVRRRLEEGHQRGDHQIRRPASAAHIVDAVNQHVVFLKHALGGSARGLFLALLLIHLPQHHFLVAVFRAPQFLRLCIEFLQHPHLFRVALLPEGAVAQLHGHCDKVVIGLHKRVVVGAAVVVQVKAA